MASEHQGVNAAACGEMKQPRLHEILGFRIIGLDSYRARAIDELIVLRIAE